jgi:alpha-galactosidase
MVMDPFPSIQPGSLKDSSLSFQAPERRFTNGRITLAYLTDEAHGRVELTLYPNVEEPRLVSRRAKDKKHPFVNDGGRFCAPGDAGEDSIVHAHLRGDAFCDGFTNGHSQRFSATTQNLRFKKQHFLETEAGIYVETLLENPGRLRCRHQAWVPADADGAFIRCSAENISRETQVLEHLTSFAIGKLSPFAEDDMPERMHVHRLRSIWSAEGKWERQSIEDLHMERSWAGHSILNLSFGQVGSMPVRGFFPLAAIEDSEANVFWGAQTAYHGSWQMEVWRRKDPLCLSGGLGSYDQTHWAKALKPKEAFTAPLAWLVTVSGDRADLCDALRQQYAYTSHPEPESESKLPVIFNEWCSSWGHPHHDDILEKAPLLEEAGADIFVIDDGWAEKPDGTFQFNGDWNLNESKFPYGLRSTSWELKKHHLTTGIWFEAEVCTDGTEAFNLTDHHLKRHGRTIQVGSRHFWDFRDPFTVKYLEQKMVKFLLENEIKYLKIDYNDSIGIGCDGENAEDGLGEGLRQHLEAVKAFYLNLRKKIPDLTFENCSSGGHRLEPGFVALTSMSSFSDAHETVEIPIIAANIQEVIPARKNQVWAVIREADDDRRLNWSLAACFLGRMCLSGDLQKLTPEARQRVRRAVSLYREARPILQEGSSRIQRRIGPSWRHPKGWQCVLRQGTEDHAGKLLAVFHAFENEGPTEISIRLPEGDWRVRDTLFYGDLKARKQELRITFRGSFSGGMALLEKTAD